MAALRSGMAMLARRSCGPSGSSAAAAMGGKGMQVHQVLRPAPPPLNHEGRRRFSTGGGEPKGKTESFPRILWQWAKYRAKNADPVTKSKALAAYGVVVMGTPLMCLVYVSNEYIM